MDPVSEQPKPLIPESASPALNTAIEQEQTRVKLAREFAVKAVKHAQKDGFSQVREMKGSNSQDSTFAQVVLRSGDKVFDVTFGKRNVSEDQESEETSFELTASERGEPRHAPGRRTLRIRRGISFESDDQRTERESLSFAVTTGRGIPLAPRETALRREDSLAFLRELLESQVDSDLTTAKFEEVQKNKTYPSWELREIYWNKDRSITQLADSSAE